MRIEPWGVDDLPVLERANTPEMTEFVGGPESAEAIAARHAKYLRGRETGENRMFTIRADGAAVGGVGLWPIDWRDEPAYETGWNVDPGHQGRGIASAAMRLLIDDARAHREPGRHLLLAFPMTVNAPSNALCRRLGFELRGEQGFEGRGGATILVNAWAIDLRG